jgi:hypothetical protein
MNKLEISFFMLLAVLGFAVTPAFAAPHSNPHLPPQAAVGAYSLSITSGPVVVGRDVSLNGVASATNYLGSFSQYGIVILWGDNTQTVYSSLATLGFIDNGTDFSGSWASQHTYAYPGNYNIQVNLYRNSPSAMPAASDSISASIVCFPDFPPFFAPC